MTATSRSDKFSVGVIQAAPVYFDAHASVEKACGLIREAGARGVALAAFGETWIPGYPFFAMMPPLPLWYEAAAAYHANAIDLDGPEVADLCKSARDANIDVAIGIAERDPRTRGSVYCTLLLIGREGRLLGRHRKLKPTAHERAIWADGDASGLRVHDRHYGRIAGLNCWEHQMGLPGYVLASQGLDVHVATWPGAELSAPPAPGCSTTRQLLLSRAFASQAACYVLAVGGVGTPDHMPERFRELMPFAASGDSYIIDPRGEVITGPAVGEEILCAEVDRTLIRAAKSVFDVGGHYSRPDIFRLIVKTDEAMRSEYDGATT